MGSRRLPGGQTIPPHRSSRPNEPDQNRLRQTHAHQRRPQSPIVLPPWQPDGEVGRCPNCDTQFTFFWRKHHCRKCGRVVCDQCSRHRIRIPTSFIIRPPFLEAPEPEDGSIYESEVVRVCNPCVPDPNFSPPPQAAVETAGGAVPQPPQFPQLPQRTSTSNAASIPLAGPETAVHRGSRRVPQIATSMPTGASFHSAERRDRISTSHHSTRFHTRSGLHGEQAGPSRLSFDGGFHRRHHGTTRGALPTDNEQSLLHRPQRDIPEEDECPVCGEELPPRGPDGDESDRTRHVEECIISHSLSRGTPRSLGDASSPVASLLRHSTSPTEHFAPRGNRMVVYHATEKDYAGEDGEPSECVICFEEFEPGDEMGRLDCFCKFHRHCIRSWWDTKGAGTCPTHQLHD